MHTLANQEMTSFFDEIESSYVKVMNGLRAEITQWAEGPERTRLLELVDNLGDVHNLRVRTRADERAIIDEGIRAEGKTNWDNINAQRHELWTGPGGYDEVAHELAIAFHARARTMGKPLGTIDQVIGDLTPAHVARLYAVSGDDISRGLIQVETMTLMPKRKFVGYARVQADVLASELGKTADELGLTREAVERVYDQILAKLRMDPKIVRTMEPMKSSLEGVRQGLHDITNRRGLPAGEADKFNQYLEGVASKLEESSMFGGLKPSKLRRVRSEWDATGMDRALRGEVEDVGIERWTGEYTSRGRTYGITVFRESGDQSHIARVSYAEGRGKGAGRLEDVADEIAEDLSRLGFTDIWYDVSDVISAQGAARERMFGRMVEKVKSRMGDVPTPKVEVSPEWAATREKAMDQTRVGFELDFTDYSHQNMFDAYMRRLMPFWTYESQRWPYLARAAVSTPGVFTSWGKYMDYSDTGYIDIPSTDIQINPFRGTVFMGGLRRFYMRDYPEYYSGWHGYPRSPAPPRTPVP